MDTPVDTTPSTNPSGVVDRLQTGIGSLVDTIRGRALPRRATTWHPDLGSGPDEERQRVTVERAESIAFTPMAPPLRNELITLAYGDLAEEMAEVLGHENGTWCSFGQWASSSIGEFLRFPIPGLGRLISRAFGDGNRDVFADVGRAHVHFLETVGAAARSGGDLDDAWKACCTRLEQSLAPPPSQPIAPSDETHTLAELLMDGVENPLVRPRRDLLIRGFQAYREAIEEDDPETKAQLILLGNALIGLHEQITLGPAISAGFRSWIRHLTTFWRIGTTSYRWRNTDPGPRRLALENWWIRTATHRFVRVELPGRRIHCGAAMTPSAHRIDVEPLPPTMPPTASIHEMPSTFVLALLCQTLRVDGRAAVCWADLNDRMAFIVALFANEQRSPTLLDSSGEWIRPQPRRRIWRRIERVERRVGVSMPPYPPTIGTFLTDQDLDEFRRLPISNIAMEDLACRHQHAHELSCLEDDFEHRVATACGPDGLLDAETVRKARTLFHEWSILFFMGLLFRSLPDGYAARKGVRVLGLVSDLATNPVRRVGETAQFLNDIFVQTTSWSSEGLAADGPAFASLRGVRVIHALVSDQLMTSDQWDEDDLGIPINVEDVLGTMLSFFVPPFELMDELGAHISEEDRNVYTRFWCGIGYVMGLPLRAVTLPVPAGGRRPLNSDDAERLSAQIRARQHERSLDGVRLAEALVEGVSDGFPRATSWLSAGFFHVLGDGHVNRLLLISERRGWRRARILGTGLRLLLRFPATRGLTRRLTQLAGRLWLRPFLDEGMEVPFRRLPRISETPAPPPPLATHHEYWPRGCG